MIHSDICTHSANFIYSTLEPTQNPSNIRSLTLTPTFSFTQILSITQKHFAFTLETFSLLLRFLLTIENCLNLALCWINIEKQHLLHQCCLNYLVHCSKFQSVSFLALGLTFCSRHNLNWVGDYSGD